MGKKVLLTVRLRLALNTSRDGGGTRDPPPPHAAVVLRNWRKLCLTFFPGCFSEEESDRAVGEEESDRAVGEEESDRGVFQVESWKTQIPRFCKTFLKLFIALFRFPRARDVWRTCRGHYGAGCQCVCVHAHAHACLPARSPCVCITAPVHAPAVWVSQTCLHPYGNNMLP